MMASEIVFRTQGVSHAAVEQEDDSRTRLLQRRVETDALDPEKRGMFRAV